MPNQIDSPVFPQSPARAVTPSVLSRVPVTAANVRVRWDRTPGPSGTCDGVWWPRTRDLGCELPALIATVGQTLGTVVAVVVDAAAWGDVPADVVVDGRAVAVRSFSAGEPPPDLGAPHPNPVLLVLPPPTSGRAAGTVMELVVRPPHTLTVGDLVGRHRPGSGAGSVGVPAGARAGGTAAATAGDARLAGPGTPVTPAARSVGVRRDERDDADPSASPSGSRYRPTVGDIMTAAEFQVADDLTVDAALEIMNGAHIDYLPLRGHDGRCSGLLTRAQLAPYQARVWYTERLHISEIAHDTGGFALESTPLDEAIATMRDRGLRVWPVVDADGFMVAVIDLDESASGALFRP